jgi:hypothetical protein
MRFDPTKLRGRTIVDAWVKECQDQHLDQTDAILELHLDGGEIVSLIAYDPNAESYFVEFAELDEEEKADMESEGYKISYVTPSTQ